MPLLDSAYCLQILLFWASFSQSCSDVAPSCTVGWWGLLAVTGVTSSCARSSSHSCTWLWMFFLLQHTLQACVLSSIWQPVKRRASFTISLSDAGTDNIQPFDIANPHLLCVFGSWKGMLALQPRFGYVPTSFSSLTLHFSVGSW